MFTMPEMGALLMLHIMRKGCSVWRWYLSTIDPFSYEVVVMLLVCAGHVISCDTTTHLYRNRLHPFEVT
jgi:hypothetical protein